MDSYRLTIVRHFPADEFSAIGPPNVRKEYAWFACAARPRAGLSEPQAQARGNLCACCPFAQIPTRLRLGLGLQTVCLRAGRHKIRVRSAACGQMAEETACG